MVKKRIKTMNEILSKRVPNNIKIKKPRKSVKRPIMVRRSRFGDTQIEIQDINLSEVDSKLVCFNSGYVFSNLLSSLYNSNHLVPDLFMNIFNCLNQDHISLPELHQALIVYATSDYATSSMCSLFETAYTSAYNGTMNIAKAVNNSLSKNNLPSGVTEAQFLFCLLSDIKGNEIYPVDLKTFTDEFKNQSSNIDCTKMDEVFATYQSIIQGISNNAVTPNDDQYKLEKISTNLSILLLDDPKSLKEIQLNLVKKKVYCEFLKNFPCYDNFLNDITNIKEQKSEKDDQGNPTFTALTVQDTEQAKQQVKTQYSLEKAQQEATQKATQVGLQGVSQAIQGSQTPVQGVTEGKTQDYSAHIADIDENGVITLINGGGTVGTVGKDLDIDENGVITRVKDGEIVGIVDTDTNKIHQIVLTPEGTAIDHKGNEVGTVDPDTSQVVSQGRVVGTVKQSGQVFLAQALQQAQTKIQQAQTKAKLSLISIAVAQAEAKKTQAEAAVAQAEAKKNQAEAAVAQATQQAGSDDDDDVKRQAAEDLAKATRELRLAEEEAILAEEEAGFAEEDAKRKKQAIDNVSKYVKIFRNHDLKGLLDRAEVNQKDINHVCDNLYKILGSRRGEMAALEKKLECYIHNFVEIEKIKNDADKEINEIEKEKKYFIKNVTQPGTFNNFKTQYYQPIVDIYNKINTEIEQMKNDFKESQMKAATKLQAAARGYQARKSNQSLRETKAQKKIAALFKSFKLRQQSKKQMQALIAQNKVLIAQNKSILQDIIAYMCRFYHVLHDICKNYNNIVSLLIYVNPVFANIMTSKTTFSGDVGTRLKGIKLDYYYDYRSQNAASFYTTVSNLYTDKEVSILNDLLKQIKDDYEVLRGPVRVYLKLKGAFGGRESKNSGLISAADSYNIKLSDFCTNLVKNPNQTYSDVFDYISGNKTDGKGPYSYVYDQKDGAEVMFKNSMLETIDNMIGSTNQIIMAYGPSGSGKTYNLIGEKFGTDKSVDGVIKYAIRHLMNHRNVEKVTVSSYQFYNFCTSGKAKTLKFDSLVHNTEDDIDEVKNRIQNPSYTVANFTSKILLKHPYKFKQDEEKNAIGVDEFLNIAKQYIPDDGSIANISLDNRNKIAIAIIEKVNSGNNIKSGVVITPRVLFYTNKQDNRYFFWRQGKNLIPNSKLGNVENMTLDSLFRMFSIIGLDDNVSIGGPPGILKERKLQGKQVREIRPKFDGIIVPNGGLTIGNVKRHEFSKLNKIFEGINDFGQIEENKKEQIVDFLMGSVMDKLINFINLYDAKYKFLMTKINEQLNTGSYINNDTEFTEIELNDKNWESAFEKTYILAEKNRPSRGTPLNPDSSRSHLAFEFKITPKEGKETSLTFIDLAGNEKADENLFQMRAEGDGIMASLLAMKKILQRKQNGELSVKSADDGKIKEDNLKTYFSLPLVYGRCYSNGNNNSNSCYNKMYNELKDLYEDDMTTVSIYLNLPKFMLDTSIPSNKISNINRCMAIGDSLRLVQDLLEGTKIAGIINNQTADITTCISATQTKYNVSFGRRVRKRKSKKTLKSQRKLVKKKVEDKKKRNVSRKVSKRGSIRKTR